MVRAVDAENPSTGIIRYEQVARGNLVEISQVYSVYYFTIFFNDQDQLVVIH